MQSLVIAQGEHAQVATSISSDGAASRAVTPSFTVTKVTVTLLAVIATGTSAAIATVAGWDRGGQLAERLAWIFVGLVLLLSAHLIPALSRGLPVGSRVAALILWACSMVATGYGHATFFLLAQQHAGAQRAAVIPPHTPSLAFETAGRSPATVAIERAQVERDLAIADAQKCRGVCTWLSLRKQSLTARLTALGVEFDESIRRERLADRAAADKDRVTAQRDSAMTDPVTALVARSSGLNNGTVNLLVALSFGWLLEAVGCLAWLLALPREVTARHAVTNSTRAGLAHCQPTAGEVSLESHTSDPNEDASRRDSNETASSEEGGAISGQGDALRTTPTEAASDGARGTALVERHAALLSDVSHAAPTSSAIQPTDIVPRSSDLERLVLACNDGTLRPTVVEIRRYLRCSQRRASTLRRALFESAAVRVP